MSENREPQNIEGKENFIISASGGFGIGYSKQGVDTGCWSPAARFWPIVDPETRYQQQKGRHPAFSVEHFWIPACAGMTSFEKKLLDPSNKQFFKVGSRDTDDFDGFIAVRSFNHDIYWHEVGGFAVTDTYGTCQINHIF